jgi:hypothetical protein
MVSTEAAVSAPEQPEVSNRYLEQISRTDIKTAAVDPLPARNRLGSVASPRMIFLLYFTMR